MKRKATGERGSWFAKVDGKRLPCVHQYWVRGTHHCDPGLQMGEGKWPEFVEAIKAEKTVVLTKDRPLFDDPETEELAFERIGYIAVFEVDNVETSAAGLEFDLVRRVAELK